jgi:hypothetical protein
MNLFGYNLGIFRSLQSKIFIIVALLTLILSLIKYRSFKFIIIQLIIYIIVSKEIDCSIYGGCHINGWMRVLLPVLIFIIILLDHLKLYNLTKIFKVMMYFVKKANISEKDMIQINNQKILLF